MGLFDIFKGGDKGAEKAPKKASSRELARYAKLVGNKMTQNFDRQEAIEELGKMGTGEAAAILLARFNWTMEPSITDQDEKESACRGIIASGDAALEPIRAYCKKAESLTWPLKALKGIADEDRYYDEVLAVLDQFDTEYVRNPEPKIQLIKMLSEFANDEVRVAVEPFVEDASEPVRFAAVDTVFAMKLDASVPALVAALGEEESLRVKNRIAQGFINKSWEVPEDLREDCADALPPDYRLDGGRVVPA